MTVYMKREAKKMEAKGKSHRVEDLGGGLYEVTSGSSGKAYRVTVRGDGTAFCSCDWGRWTKAGQGVACSHTLAVLDFVAKGAGRYASAWASAEAAKRQRKPTLDTGDGVAVTFGKRR